jgi:hypothetical protein
LSTTIELPHRPGELSGPVTATVSRLLDRSPIRIGFPDALAVVEYPSMGDAAREWGLAVEELSTSVPFRGFVDAGTPMESLFAETVATWLDRDTTVTVEVMDLPELVAAPLAIGPAAGVLTLADLPAETEVTP